MRYCSQCGTQLNDICMFCKECGQPVNNQKPIAGNEEFSIQKNTTGDEIPIQINTAGNEEIPAQNNMTGNEEMPVQKNMTGNEKMSAQNNTTGNGKMPVQKNNAERAEKKTVGAVAGLLTKTTTAPETAGELFLPFPAANSEGIMNAVGPVKLLFGGFVNILKGFKAAVKDKKRLIPAIVLVIVWLVMTLLPAAGVDLSSVKWLSWLTFANGGTTGPILSKFGGIIGKGLLAYFITTIITSVAAKRNPLKGIFGSLKKVFSSLSFKNSLKLSLLLFGMGSAFVAYNFLTGNGALTFSMMGITGFLLILRSMSLKSGFFRRFISSLITKKGRAVDDSAVTGVMSGWVLGFAISVPVSAAPVPWIGYYVGSGLILLAVILRILSLNKKEAAAV